jgi:hypothetical protein
MLTGHDRENSDTDCARFPDSEVSIPEKRLPIGGATTINLFGAGAGDAH